MMDKSELIAKAQRYVEEVFETKQSEYETKLHLVRHFLDRFKDRIQDAYKDKSGKKLVKCVYVMMKEIHLNQKDADRASSAMKAVALINTIIQFMIFVISYVGLLLALPGLLSSPLFVFIPAILIIRIVVSFFSMIMTVVVVAPVVEETSKLIFSNSNFITKFVHMFNLDESMQYFIKPISRTRVEYDVETGIDRINTMNLHVITAYITKTKAVFGSRILSWLKAISVHMMFNLTATLEAFGFGSPWKNYCKHLSEKYGNLVDEYIKDAKELKKTKEKTEAFLNHYFPMINESIKHKITIEVLKETLKTYKRGGELY